MFNKNLYIPIIYFVFFIVSCKSRLERHRFNNPCDSASIMVTFIDSTGELVKSGVVGVNDPRTEENDYAIARDSERIFEVNSMGYVCVPKNILMAKYNVAAKDTLFAFYFKEDYSYTPFKLSLSQDTLSIKLLFYPRLKEF